MRGIVQRGTERHHLILEEADTFIRQAGNELGWPDDQIKLRLLEVAQHIEASGSYTLSFEELEHGARMAWRNANRCIGRLFWNRLHVFDARSCKTADEVYEALLKHLVFATNGGEIRPAITIFEPAAAGESRVRIWNHQLLRYAGYETESGVIGDPSSIRFTEVCRQLGWKGKGTAFDILPLVIQIGGEEPHWYSIPEDLVLEVTLKHPEADIFGETDVKWYAVPIISDMALEISGMHFTAAPFNGWYMGTEIGARNLADEQRYNLLPQVAGNLGLDTSSNSSLWKDRALVELNVAVLHSFREAGVSIVDHHTAAQQFNMFQRNEERAGRDLTGRWSWLIPPLSPATTDIFHRSYEDRTVKPGYEAQPLPYK